MRDIVTVSYNHAPKPVSNPNDYKSYRDFLENYSDTKNSKDDAESVSSNDSGVSSYKLLESKSNNTSTSSLNSDVVVNGGTTVFSKGESTPTGIMGGTRTGSFRKYLDDYNNKKYSSVKPAFCSKPKVTTTVKSEIVIQVSDPLDIKTVAANLKPVVTQKPPLVRNVSPTPPRSPPQPQQFLITLPPSVLKTQICNIVPSPPVLKLHTNDVVPPPPPPIKHIPKESAMNNISPPPLIDNIPPPPPMDNIPLPPPIDNIPPPPPLLELPNATPKKWATVLTENCQTIINEPPKIPKNNLAAANLAKILNEHVLARRKKSETESPSDTNGEIKPILNVKASTLPRQLEKSLSSPVTALRSSVSPPRLPVAPAKFVMPPPKQLEPEKPQVFTKLPPSLPKSQRSISPKSRTNVIDTVDFCTTTVVPVNDASANLNKGDPNVKKLVYNTYRGLLGAYNNKANDMISTLPRSMVREDKGVSKQLESILLQCPMDKLNGRVNPKLEQE